MTTSGKQMYFVLNRIKIMKLISVSILPAYVQSKPKAKVLQISLKVPVSEGLNI